MALPAFADLTDMEVRLGRTLSGSELLRAQAALDDASGIIAIEGGGWTSLTDIGEAYQPAITAIACAVARRIIDNPDGFTEMHVGDVGGSLAESSSDVYLKASERRVIARASGRSTFGSVELYTGTPGLSTEYIPVVGQDEPMPFTYEPLRSS